MYNNCNCTLLLSHQRLPPVERSAAITAVADRLVDAKGQGSQVARWEQELNALVYELYGLTEDEIGLIEAQTGRSARP